MRKIILLLVVLGLNQSFFAQNIDLFIQESRYTISHRPPFIKNYFFFGNYYIDKNNEQIINLTTLQAGVNKVVDDSLSTDLIVLDIENDIYKSLRNNSKSNVSYEVGIKKMIQMVDSVKYVRPLAKVVVYGLPFSFTTSNQKLFNDFEKLEPLLQKVDYLAPSLYLYFADEKKNIEYLKDNLTLFLDYSFKLKKQLVPFIWYRIHPASKSSGGNLITDEMYTNYINYILNFKYNKQGVSGLIYWEPSKSTIDINKKLLQTVNIINNDFTHNK